MSPPVHVTVADVLPGRFEVTTETGADGELFVTVGFWTPGRGNQVFRLGLTDAESLTEALLVEVAGAKVKLHER